MSRLDNEAPGPSPRVILTAREAIALRAYVHGDSFDVKAIDSAIAQIDGILDGIEE